MVAKCSEFHLFSNILDIDEFSLTNLLKLIEFNFSGDNYFICVSPYINDIRTSRLDAFVKYFSKKANFKKIESIDCFVPPPKKKSAEKTFCGFLYMLTTTVTTQPIAKFAVHRRYFFLR